MQSTARDSYLVAEVMTAPPQKLHLMLIEAAIRFAEKARKHWAAQENDLALESLIRAQEIVGEMLAGLNREVDAQLVGRVASVYLFVFRRLMEAASSRDEAKLADALRILEINRQTWREVCGRLSGAGESFSPSRAAVAAPLPAEPTPGDAPGAAFSMDA